MQAMRVSLFGPVRRVSWTRIAALGVLCALTSFMAGDGLRAATNSGIDPFEILKLQVRPNVIIVLDSSGSMRQRPAATGTDYSNPGPTNANAATVGDDHDSKIWNAKDVIRKIVTDNQTKVNFMFGQYTNSSSSFGPETGPTFLYKVKCAASDTACQSAAALISISNFDTARLRRRTTSDVFTETDGSKTYYLEANRFYNGVIVNVFPGGACGTTCTTTTGAPAKANPAPVKVQMLDSSGNPTGTPVTFYFQGVRWNVSNSGTSCNGFQARVSLQACTNNDQLGLFEPFLADEVPKDAATGDIVGYNPATDTLSKLATLTGGMRASGMTPIANSLDDIKTEFDTNIWPNRPNANQRTFVIFVTDGDDTCGGYRQAAYSAQKLYDAGASDVTKIVNSFIVVFGNGATVNQANQIAYGGSGMTAVQNDGTRWTSDATAAQIAACTTCRRAFTASTTSDLEAAIQSAIDQGVASGEFSDQQSITESVFELGPFLSSPIDPMDPSTRYNATIPVLLQSTFELSTFAGHLKAFRNVGNTSSLLWDAGEKLCERVTGFVAKAGAVPAVCDIGGTAATGADTPSTAMGTGSYNFDALTATSTPAAIATSSARIKRRIFTTSQNGVNASYTASNLVTTGSTSAMWSAQVPLWPPNANVDPARQGNSFPAGSLDVALGVTALTPPQLTSLGVCQVTADTGFTTLTSDCGRAGYTAKEARQIILAFAAGAQVDLGTDGKPKRDPGTGTILYKARTWILAESTLAAPGIVSTPLQNTTAVHGPEYTLYRDGARSATRTAVNGTLLGFGLRNPDTDGQASSKGDPTLKPVMSVVYHGTNMMLHAFRAGPCPASVSSCGGETGGEELWAFVPYDQLGKLYTRMVQGQSRTKPIYVVAAPVRFADVFVPGSFNKTVGSVSISGTGVWRVVMLVGRGAAGKSMTAIDVTVPGPFTTRSNQTSAPVIVWNRGNPDTNDGLVKSGSNSYNNTTGAGAGDYNAYLKMGETWSVPAVGYVTAANNVTTRKPSGVEFVAWLGSGYSDVAGEGRTFYALDALTGDVIGSSSQAAFTITDRTSALPTPNALVASPSAYADLPLSWYNTAAAASVSQFNPITEKVTAVYFPDLHGRVFRYLPDSSTSAPTLFRDLSADGNQPVANAVALLSFDSNSTGNKPHVFVEAGNDSRVALPTSSPFFRMYALRDDGATETDVFSPIDFPSGFRGTVQPATVFNANGKPRVFFAGTRFNPTGSDCVSSFDSVIFALEGATGLAAYDLNSSGDDSSVTITNQRVNAVRTSGGQLVTDFGLGAQVPPPPPAPPVVTTGVSSGQSNVFVAANVPGMIPFKVGSSVCR
jgi:hypothetical protein